MPKIYKTLFVTALCLLLPLDSIDSAIAQQDLYLTRPGNFGFQLKTQIIGEDPNNTGIRLFVIDDLHVYEHFTGNDDSEPGYTSHGVFRDRGGDLPTITEKESEALQERKIAYLFVLFDNRISENLKIERTTYDVSDPNNRTMHVTLGLDFKTDSEQKWVIQNLMLQPRDYARFILRGNDTYMDPTSGETKPLTAAQIDTWDVQLNIHNGLTASGEGGPFQPQKLVAQRHRKTAETVEIAALNASSPNYHMHELHNDHHCPLLEGIVFKSAP